VNVSIVLPTRNAGPLLAEVLDAVQAQRYERGAVEVLAVDSGSTDGTLALLEQRGVERLDVPPELFDHGATRDLAIARTSGEAVVLLVQDALPEGPLWLEGLVRELEDPAVAGVYARQVPRPGCAAVTAARVRSYLGGLDERRVQRLEHGTQLEDLAPAERWRLCCFDNVCSALRRSVWEELPFGRCEFAEDLRWARGAIQAGHTLIYTPEARVVHSHDRSLRFEMRRTYLSHYALNQLFGLWTVPTWVGVLRSFLSSGEWMGIALRGEPTIGRKLTAALRAPIERTLTAYAQYRGARDARRGRPARRFRSI